MTETPVETLVADAPSGDPGARARAVARAVLRAPIQLRTWKEIAYLLTAFLLGGLAATWGYLAVGGGILFSFTIVGVPVLALVLLGGRVWGRIYLALAKDLLDSPLPAPPKFAPVPGLFGFLKSAFTDRTSWRALLFLFLQVILGLVVGYFVLAAIAMAVFLVLSPVVWAVFHPTNIDSNGVERHSMLQFGNFYFDTWPRMLLLSLVGVVALFVLPWLIRAICVVHRLLIAALLSSTARDRRMHELTVSRQIAVEDSATTLRRVERDLHDGAQARLVTIAMTLGRAEERIAAGGDATELIADARASSKEALTELRELVRGIHPPALELGLAPALETLSSRCAIPVELRVLLPERPSPAVEAIAYFSVAELLTNVVKHANADRAWVSVVPTDARTIAITVRDNGIGGVLPPESGVIGVGSGLSGLAARARSVDGTLTVQSPPGGPTAVTLLLPKEVSR
ncbi:MULTISPECIES: sensor domain-containing protein [unclassified Nocardia]|uniref:sensor histidine kinase n=1 Tax=unclassified Nocardia TaxID=2637762 RepID=UPI001CE3EEB1|nr:MULTISPECIES: sensor domain-containing protein [unclassified Nocardia]